MFPIKDSIKAHHFPVLNFLLVGITVYVFIQQILAPDQLAFINKYALIPAHIDWNNFRTWTPFVTSIFLHGGLLHILSNMWFLIVFGDNVNDRLSPISFLLLYLIAGIAGDLAQYIFMPGATVPMLGASGAVAGILGCYAILFPSAKVKTLIFIIFFVTILDISAPILLGYWFLLQLFSGVGSIGMSADQGGVAYMAHIAGFIVGLLWGLANKNRGEAAGGIQHE